MICLLTWCFQKDGQSGQLTMRCTAIYLTIKGRKRAAIFYKAAFYDRNADLSLTSRFSFGLDYGLEDAVQCVIFDCGKEVSRTEKVECERYSGEYWAASKLLKEAAMEWLNNRIPRMARCSRLLGLSENISDKYNRQTGKN